MFGMGLPEILCILVIALVVIGPKKLPELAKSLGRAMGEFKRATVDLKDSINVEAPVMKPGKRISYPQVNAGKSDTNDLSGAASLNPVSENEHPEPEVKEDPVLSSDEDCSESRGSNHDS